MTNFQEKELNDRSLGDLLRERREELGQSLEDVERATRVSKKYLAALEASEYGKIPEAVYARKFVRALAEHYAIDADAAAEQLVREMAASAGTSMTRHPITFVEGRRLIVTPRLLKTGGFIAAFVAIFAYFLFSVHHILKPPALTLYSPQDDQVLMSSRVAFEGLTEPEVDLTVNGDPVFVETDGSFKDILTLPPGVSNLRIAAKKKHSRERELLIKVIVDMPALPGGSATATEETAEDAPPPAATATPPVRTPPRPPVVVPVPDEIPEPEPTESASGA